MAKHSIRLLYDVPGWAYHNRCLALEKYAPDDFDVSHGMCMPDLFAPGPFDLVLQLASHWLRQTRAYYPEAVLVGGMNVGWTESHAKRLTHGLAYADHIIINSKSCWEAAGRPDRTTWISNGVDRDTYRCEVPIMARAPKVLWVGSEFHQRQTNLKQYDAIILPVAQRLQECGILYNFRLANSISGPSKWSATRMVRWYNTGTVYVCASIAEGTPNPALEAAACGAVVVSTPVGNMPELIEHGVNGMLVERTVDDVLRGILSCIDGYRRMATAMQSRIVGWDWRERARDYYDLFRRLLDV